MNKAREIAEKLTKEQIIYLHIANELFSGSDIFCDSIVDDVQDTEGEFGSDNWVALDYYEQEFDNDHVAEVIEEWKMLLDEDGFLDERYSSLDVLDMLLGDCTMLDSFYGVTYNVVGETGSYAWKPRGEHEVEIIEILEEANADEIVAEFIKS